MKRLFLKLLLLLFSFSLLSCVGTVEEGSVESSYTTVSDESEISFSGVSEVQGVSDSRVEVFFTPARGGSGKYNYKINLGGGLIPVSVPSEVLKADYRGYLKYTVTDLRPSYLYKISVDAQDQETLITKKTEKLLETKTFGDVTCNFNGITSVDNLPGVAGTDSLRISWVNAEVTGTLIAPAKSDPIQYEITLLDANTYKPSNIYDVGLNNGVGRFVESVSHSDFTSEVLIRGLPAGTEYYVHVRCYNKAREDRPGNIDFPQYDGEMNTNYVKKSTLDDSLSSIDFDKNLMVLAPGSGVDASKTFSLTWGEIKGVFEHFRIYYTNGSFSEGDIKSECSVNVPDGNMYCKKASYNIDRVQVFPLTSNSTYDVALVICQDFACTSRKIAKTWSYDTTVADAGFNGLTEIQSAKSLEDIGTLRLVFGMPDLSVGTYDGFVVKHKLDSLNGSEIDITNETTYNGTIEVADYDIATATSLTLNNIDYGSSHCFNVSLFRWMSGGTKKEISNDKWDCITPEISAPLLSDFTGFTEGRSITSSTSSKLTVEWNLPTKGVYEKFIIYIKHNGADAFNYTTAERETSAGNFDNYTRFVINDTEETKHTFEYLTVGETLKVGIETAYVSSSSVLRSPTNLGVLSCTVPSVGTGGKTESADCSFQ